MPRMGKEKLASLSRLEMCFNMCCIELKRQWKLLVFAAAVLCWLSPSTTGQMIDRIAALVGDKVITWSDIQIAREFQLFDIQHVPSSDWDRFILEKLIDQQLILQKMGEDMVISDEESKKALESSLRRIGEDRSMERMKAFGLLREDLFPYFREKLLFQKITSERFKSSIFIGLKEMESYYREVYLPERETIGLKALPLLEILNEIEAAIREAKIKKLVEEWLRMLREEANIQILIDTTRAAW